MACSWILQIRTKVLCQELPWCPYCEECPAAAEMGRAGDHGDEPPLMVGRDDRVSFAADVAKPARLCTDGSEATQPVSGVRQARNVRRRTRFGRRGTKFLESRSIDSGT